MNKIRIILLSYDHQLIQKAGIRIINSVEPTGALIAGPVPLKTKKEVFTVLRSPHVSKNSREQFMQCTYKRLIDIYLPAIPNRTLERLNELELPLGVYTFVQAYKQK